jgi:acetamidase/formamidase
MATHRFTPTHFHNTLGSHPPVLEIDDGDSVITETLDAHGLDHEGKKRGNDPNPMTGPFFVRRAAPGDALSIQIRRITMIRATGWTRQGLAHGVVDPSAVPQLPPREKITWLIDNNAGEARLMVPPAGLKDWAVPIIPMIGCFGVAPDMGQAISTATSGPHGGNMDYRRFGEGATATFPVSAEGALFFIGDVHAAQGDGEIAGTGIETAAEVEFTVKLLKGRKLNWPRGETADHIFTVANVRPLDQALQHATTEMLNLLQKEKGLDAIAASHLMAIAVRYDVANVFNPAFSVACRIARRWLPA